MEKEFAAPCQQNNILDNDFGFLLQEYVNIVKKIYKDSLLKIVLFGSYARGDYNDESDIDIMIFLNVPPHKERRKIKELIGNTFDFNLDHNVDIQPIPKSIYTFRKWENILPFYQTINKEGVILYE